MELEGEVTSGLGEGKNYIGKEVYQKIFREKLHFQPFEGTLNLKVDKSKRKKVEANSQTIQIQDVHESGERLSDVEVTPCKIKGINCGMLKLEFTDHPDTIVEVIAPVKLREKFNLEDGDLVTVEVP